MFGAPKIKCSSWNEVKGRLALHQRHRLGALVTTLASVKRERVMMTAKEKAAEFRRQAAICLDVAQRISLKEDRDKMMQVAKHWLELAKHAEAETS
jgi:hypothetical protein